ncbi:bifunctional 3-(3-hydroxy-phenyl)propionate/3-hydroxycinnamic acid hydroxylase [Brachybacterium paraconglomeratum]|uniref:bifunctional 3-(3-hydroxy-phenyl)propionate/3-hydroxycinnamic acid hydroxylase n=1 Tax=Brachybacterium paraconglomeratum TaxID=173362 RepID=UPI00223BA13A|nr:bifunctional 3-(3-hydroxy-phenyl)propionate/3-hydroxycinnamic acid hydroxylase [Brachybacterium paraconglomeratum]MCT1436674.1 bifunctional 3-(3-hydroxy-phenyl)propionate/3-hydroxycinnamic acid hydroxylase [Brachybacterium paraconglomeratum]
MTSSEHFDADVIVIGAGPAGLSVANQLGMRGISVILLESRSRLIDYPRGVGIDDESLRSLQSLGLVEQALPFTTPQHIMRMVNGRGQQITEIRPSTDEFGWSRRNAFIQPEVDRVLHEGLARFDHVEVRFDHRVERIEPEEEAVSVLGSSEDDPFILRARYLVGAEGGRSLTRKTMGVSFEGQSPSTRWIVIDVADDPIGTPNVYLGADPRRPFVSLGLPLGVRRFEFMLFDDEPDELVDDPRFVDRLLSEHVPDPAGVEFVRKRVYTHHSRIAGEFRRGRMLLVGDAAHLMPVWQGQGWNSGQRDATNLGWKLAAVLDGQCDDTLLDTYTAERHDHARSMIDLSTSFGRILSPTNRAVAGARDLAAGALNIVPKARDYFAQMKYKPMPRYREGAIVDPSTLAPGHAGPRLRRDLHARRTGPGHSPVGTQIIQPQVTTSSGSTMLLDDAIGNGWAVLQWGGNPERCFSADQRLLLRRLGAVLVSVRPVVQMTTDLPEDPDSIVLGDVSGRFKQWFDTGATPLLVIRPDRFIAAATMPQLAGRAIESLAHAVGLRAEAPPRASTVAAELAGRRTAPSLSLDGRALDDVDQAVDHAEHRADPADASPLKESA